MAQILTAPELNPTINVTNPTQDMQVAPSVQIVDFTLDNVQNYMEQKVFSMQQLDWVKIASKNKTIGNFFWNKDATTGPYEQVINHLVVKSLITIGTTFNSFTKYSRILFTIKPTSNAQFQGMMAIFFDPSPETNFLHNFAGADLSDIRIAQQFQKAWITPDNTNEIHFMIPINYPFEFWRLAVGQDTANSSKAMQEWMDHYVFGILKSVIYSPLKSTSPLLGLNFNVSAQIIDLQTAGLIITSKN